MTETNHSPQWGRRDFLRAGSLGALGAGLSAAVPGRDPACILLWQSGGCSHLDTFDMKPRAPREIRGKFREISTAVPGIRICEHLPLTARQARKFTILRSLCSAESNHEHAARLLPGGRPLLPDSARIVESTWTLETAGREFRAARWREPFPAGDPPSLTAWSEPLKNVLSVGAEPEALRERYGFTPVGQGCLLARRLIESGARFVTVGKGRPGYDAHARIFDRMENELLPEFDRAFSALLEDLEARGLLATTLVIATGEFGRTPEINSAGGRDHHAQAWSALLAGAGVPGGHVLGATDHTGREVTDSPATPEDLARTVRQILKLDAEPWTRAASGRVIRELMA